MIRAMSWKPDLMSGEREALNTRLEYRAALAAILHEQGRDPVIRPRRPSTFLTRCKATSVEKSLGPVQVWKALVFNASGINSLRPTVGSLSA
jgi:hypothetical protein